MPDVMDELSRSQRPLAVQPPAEEPPRSPVKFIVLGMLVVALAAGAWAYFHFLDRVSSDDAHPSSFHCVAMRSSLSPRRFNCLNCSVLLSSGVVSEIAACASVISRIWCRNHGSMHVRRAT